MRRPHSYSAPTVDALRVLGLEISRARRERRWTATELADRAGIGAVTLRKVERGDPTVAIGTVFEVAVLLGVPLFGVDPTELPTLAQRGQERLAVVPARVRSTRTVHDDF
jgi:transcriptional regulator with XRE-family HTH domain